MRNILCEGWVATFEIFQLQPGGGKETVRKLRIPLDHTQIKEHVQRSLCVRRSKISNSAQWSLPFPAAIGSGLDFVLVLESCYRITNSSEPSIIQLGSPAFTTPLPCHTSMQEELVARSYNYQLSDNGCYILRQEFNTMVRMEVGDPTIHSLCVLGFDSNTQSYRSYRIRGLEENLKLIKSSGIHPSLPLLLCLVRRSPIACEGMLMSFVADDADNAAIRPQTHDTLGSCSICPPREGVEYMQFSACGKNIVVKNVGNPHPAIYPLSQNTVYQSVLQREEARDQSAAWPGMDSIISHNTQNTNALIFGRPKLEIGKPTLTSSSATTDLGLSGWTTRRDVQIITTDEETTTTQHLVSLPDSWTDIGRSTDVSVTESNDGQVRIILNQGTKTWYNGPDALHRNLPVVIEKDVQALLPSRKIDTVGLLSAYEGDSDEEEEEEQEEDTFRKRRRLIGHA